MHTLRTETSDMSVRNAQDTLMDARPCFGVGLRHPHYTDFAGAASLPDFVEVHSENFFAPGGASRALIESVRARCDVSLHGVGLGLGSAVGVDPHHLTRLAELTARIDPLRVSDHACFARALRPGETVTVHGADLLPLAFTPASLDILCDNVGRVQDVLRRPILVENLSAYWAFDDDCIAEPDFLATLCQRSGCGLLLDLNNLVVNATNAGEADVVTAACRFIDALPAGAIGEYHLAGCTPVESGPVIDDHSRPVSDAVWAVYAHALQVIGPRPTLVEWDLDLPPWAVLLGEAARARAVADEFLRSTPAGTGSAASASAGAWPVQTDRSQTDRLQRDSAQASLPPVGQEASA